MRKRFIGILAAAVLAVGMPGACGTGRDAPADSTQELAGRNETVKRSGGFSLAYGRKLSEKVFGETAAGAASWERTETSGAEPEELSETTQPKSGALLETSEATGAGNPVILGVKDIYLALGCEPDYLEKVTARDRSGADLTGSVTVDDSQVRLDKEGVYQTVYRVEDRDGRITVCYADVIVVSAQRLQEMIGNREISRDDVKIFGAENPYDAGASEQDDIAASLDGARPALVQLYYEDKSGYSSGSGYVMEITEDAVYICSDRHVVEKYGSWDIYFYDGTVVKGRSFGCSDGYDVGVVEAAVQDIPEELLGRLKTVHIDKEYWGGLNDDRIDVGLLRVDRQGGVLHTSVGTLLKIKQYFAWYDNRDHTEVTAKLERGDSGSAILDGYGNLIGMAYAYSTSPRRYWCVPLDGILECYEEITGRTVFVY